MGTIVVDQKEAIPLDANGQPLSGMNVKNWRVYRVTITAGAWVELGDGEPRSTILIQAPAANPDLVIIAPTNDSHSNDPAVDTCGIEIPAGASSEPKFTQNLPIFARVAVGGADCRLVIAEAV